MEFKDLVEELNTKQEEVEVSTKESDTVESFSNISKRTFFSCQEFIEEVNNKISAKNKSYIEDYTKNITAYDLATGCIRQIYYKLKNTPVKDYTPTWAPINLRSTLGSAIHDWLMSSTDQFTETEISLKVPSQRFYGIVDAFVGDETIVEIKSCPFKDYHDVVSSGRARTKDFYQVVVYKYFLDRYIDEIRSVDESDLRTSKPKLSKYKIKNFQFIYIAHNILSHDISDLNEAVFYVDKVKEILESKNNHFYFMASLEYEDVENIPGFETLIEYVDKKLKAIQFHLENDIVPAADNEYMEREQCFFCLFKSICER